MDRPSAPPPPRPRRTDPSVLPADPCIRALERAADLAVLAPSVHNTQPWRLVMRTDRMELWADRTRQLPVLDPAGRALVQSVGAALLDARVALAAEDWAAEVERLPRPETPDLLAVLRPVAGHPDPVLAALEPAVARRHTNRRRFSADLVPDDVLQRLTDAAAAEQTALVAVLSVAHRRLVAGLTRDADAEQNASAAYRAELLRWTTRAPTSGDGVPPSAVPHVGAEPPGDLPLRDFDTQGAGTLPSDTGSPSDHTLVLLATADDDRAAWLRSGEALQRVLLEATALGWVASPLTQAIEVPHTRARLRATVTGHAYPQMLLRIGHADPTADVPHRPRDAAVANSWRRPEVPPVHGQPEPAHREPRHPVSDGRGGTTWV
ncbi:MAG: Acg family FMN-binding oxidoreductase [Blastococcus sp.]